MSLLGDNGGAVYFTTSQPLRDATPIPVAPSARPVADVGAYGYGYVPPEPPRAAAVVAIKRPTAPSRRTGSVVTVLCVLGLAAALVAIGLHGRTAREDVTMTTPPAEIGRPPPPPAPVGARPVEAPPVEARPEAPPVEPVASPTATPDASTAKSAPSEHRPKKRARKRVRRSIEEDTTQW